MMFEVSAWCLNYNLTKCFYIIISACFFRIGIDDWLRIPSVQDMYAIGDCAGFLESTGKPVLPALAQVKIHKVEFVC